MAEVVVAVVEVRQELEVLAVAVLVEIPQHHIMASMELLEQAVVVVVVETILDLVEMVVQELLSLVFLQPKHRRLYLYNTDLSSSMEAAIS